MSTRRVYMSVYGSCIHSSFKLEATQMSFNRQMDLQIMDIHKTEYYSAAGGKIMDACDNMKRVHLYKILQARVMQSERVRLSGNDGVGGGIVDCTGQERKFLGVMAMCYMFNVVVVTQMVHWSQLVHTSKKGLFWYVNYTSVKRNYVNKKETYRYLRSSFHSDCGTVLAFLWSLAPTNPQEYQVGE